MSGTLVLMTQRFGLCVNTVRQAQFAEHIAMREAVSFWPIRVRNHTMCPIFFDLKQTCCRSSRQENFAPGTPLTHFGLISPKCPGKSRLRKDCVIGSVRAVHCKRLLFNRELLCEKNCGHLCLKALPDIYPDSERRGEKSLVLALDLFKFTINLCPVSSYLE